MLAVLYLLSCLVSIFPKPGFTPLHPPIFSDLKLGDFPGLCVAFLEGTNKQIWASNGVSKQVSWSCDMGFRKGWIKVFKDWHYLHRTTLTKWLMDLEGLKKITDTKETAVVLVHIKLHLSTRELNFPLRCLLSIIGLFAVDVLETLLVRNHPNTARTMSFWQFKLHSKKRHVAPSRYIYVQLLD